MGYFDYLEEKTKEEREFRFYDVWAKVGLFVFLGSLIITIASIIIFAVSIPLGENIYLDILVGAGLIVGLLGVIFSLKAVKMAKSSRKKSDLGNFVLIWGIFFILVDMAIITANTWMFFT